MSEITITLDESLILKLPQPILAQMVLAMSGRDVTPAVEQPDFVSARKQKTIKHKPIPWTQEEKDLLFFLRDEVKDTFTEIGKVLNRRPKTCESMYVWTKRKAQQ